jgi:SET and MYND domain-containing protein
LRPVADKEIPKAVLATMELLVRRKHNLISEQTGSMLWKLEGHIADFKKNGKYGGIELMALGTSQFSFTQDTFSKDFVAELYGRVLTNSLTLITPTLDPLGIMVDPMLCHINHSCDPNVFVMMDGPKVSIRTLRPIKADEEIFISYIDTTNPYTRRQSELKSRWFFDCGCTKCQKGPTLLEDKWAIEPQRLAKQVKTVADTLIKAEAFASDPANYVGESKDERRVAAIQGRAFENYEKAQQTTDAEEAIRIIENDMRMCYESKLWPVYRQPFAALRDDLIVNLLLLGQYQVAWAQCAKRYRYITPKLYPEPHHPVRVVQTWQMAMLALYLSSEGVAMGVDLGPIAYMLILEVAEVSKLSHGEDSAFSKSVKRKLDEEAAEVRKALGDDADGIVQAGLPQQRKLLMDMGDWIQY